MNSLESLSQGPAKSGGCVRAGGCYFYYNSKGQCPALGLLKTPEGLEMAVASRVLSRPTVKTQMEEKTGAREWDCRARRAGVGEETESSVAWRP